MAQDGAIKGKGKLRWVVAAGMGLDPGNVSKEMGATRQSDAVGEMGLVRGLCGDFLAHLCVAGVDAFCESRGEAGRLCRLYRGVAGMGNSA